MRQTTTSKPELYKKNWYVISASGQTLGRFASRIALILRGKNKPTFAPYADCGDYVIVINASKIKVTGRKQSQKKYYRHSQYPGGLKTTLFSDMQKKKPNYIIEHAVRLMLPKNRLGRKQFTNLFVYEGTNHPHQAQNPVEIKIIRDSIENNRKEEGRVK